MEKYKYENQNQRQSGVAHSSASASRPEIITARNSKAGAVSGFCFDASAPVRTPRICGDVAPAAGSIRLQVRRPLVTDSRRSSWSRFDAGLDFQPTRHGLVVLVHHVSSLDVGLDLQAASHRLVVLTMRVAVPDLDAALDLQCASHRLVMIFATITGVTTPNAGFHVRLDFHSCISFL